MRLSLTAPAFPTPTKINLVCFWLFEIPLAYVLSITLRIGAAGTFYSIIIAETALALCAMHAFRRGKWKLRKV